MQTKRTLGRLSFIEKSALPKNYVPDYLVVLSGFPICVIEAKGPDVSADQAYQEALLYAQLINSHFPSGTNPLRTVVGCNGLQLLVGSWNSNDRERFTTSTLFIGSEALAALRKLIGLTTLVEQAQRIKRKSAYDHLGTPSQQINRQIFLDRVRPNALALYLNPLYEMFFRAEDPEKIQLILERAYVDTAELREYDRVLHTMLRHVEKAQPGTYQTIQTDRGREYTLTPELARYQDDIGDRGRIHLVIGSRGSGKSLFIARFFAHLMPEALKQRAVWFVIDFNRAPSDIRDIEYYICDHFVEDVQNLGFDQFDLDGLTHVFSVGGDLSPS